MVLFYMVPGSIIIGIIPSSSNAERKKNLISISLLLMDITNYFLDISTYISFSFSYP